MNYCDQPEKRRVPCSPIWKCPSPPGSFIRIVHLYSTKKLPPSENVLTEMIPVNFAFRETLTFEAPLHHASRLLLRYPCIFLFVCLYLSLLKARQILPRLVKIIADISKKTSVNYDFHMVVRLYITGCRDKIKSASAVFLTKDKRIRILIQLRIL